MLTQIKKVIEVMDDSFDTELLSYANQAIMDLRQNGITSLMEITKETKQEDICPDKPELSKGPVSSYICMYVKFVFDPPQPSMVQMQKKIIDDQLKRLSLEADFNNAEEDK